jgi:hypothetical protein
MDLYYSLHKVILKQKKNMTLDLNAFYAGKEMDVGDNT